MTNLHPDLARRARFIPRIDLTDRKLRVVRALMARRGVPKLPTVADVKVRDLRVPGLDGAPEVWVRLYQPRPRSGIREPSPALLWLHGGGYLIGSLEIDEGENLEVARSLGMTVASVEYRLAPEHPFPAAVDDALAALDWLHAEAATLGVDPDRVAVGGASAGGGLAAGLVLRAHDEGRVPVAFQLLVYPMLDDRTVARTDVDDRSLRLWSTASNRFAWRSYLPETGVGAEVSPYAAPARRIELAGLPPAWIGVGTCDLFHAEDVAYAQRLVEAGVACELVEVPGAYHGFDRVSPKTTLVREFRRSYLDALAQHLEVAR